MAQFLTLEKWIRLIAVLFGILAICLPLLRLWQRRYSRFGRSSLNHSSATHWAVVFILTIIYIAIGIVLWKPIPLDISPLWQVILTLTGSLLYFPGVFLYLWGFRSLGSMFGVSNVTGAQLYEQHQLVESGPYSLVRHPMYLGVMLVAVGALLIFRTWAMVIYTPSAFSIILRARREEELLAKEFGNAWTNYSDRVPAWIPRLRKRKRKDH